MCSIGCSGLPVASQWPPQWPPSGLPSGLPRFTILLYVCIKKNTYVQYMFFVFTPDLQIHCKEREATGEATGWPLGRPLGGHWEATVFNAASIGL